VAYSARIIADSISEAGNRLTTMEVSFPRCVLAEFNTHRMFSRNSASSRAIPVKKQIERVMNDPFIPIYWGVNKPGMSAESELEGTERIRAEAEWLTARDRAVEAVERLLGFNLHKQIVNRLLEPFMWQTVLVTATEWRNFFARRANAQAQPEIRKIAELMQKECAASVPKKLKKGEWHLPLIQEDELEWASLNQGEAIKVSVGRCARVSYLTHDGVRDHDKDIELYERLVSSGHMSPLEHVATPAWHLEGGWNEYGSGWEQPQPYKVCEWHGNFHGWRQYRKTIKHEHDFSLVANAT
jgi:thymidylate synthase ThyX